MSKRQYVGPLVAVARFYSMEGRIGVIRFALVVAVVLSLLYGIAWGFAAFGTATYAVLGAFAGAVLTKFFAEAGRRCHDMGHRSTMGALVIVVTSTAALCIVAHMLVGLAAIFVGIAAALAFAAMFLRPGQAIANAQGAPPSGLLGSSKPHAAHGDRRSLILASMSILGCAALGLAVQKTTDQVRADREDFVVSGI